MRRLSLTALIAFLSLVAGSQSLKAQPVQVIHPTTTLWNVWTNGTDPGYGLTPGSPDWAQLTFDDSLWPTGTGLFGNDAGYPYPFVTITPPPSVAVRFYARTRFTWNGTTTGVVLSGTNFIDDGAVIYLNGVEIYRFLMPEGPTTFGTLATGTAGEPIIVRFSNPLDLLTNGNPNPLRTGENVIAVETASNAASSSDTVWGGSFYISQVIAPCTDGISPTNRTVVACRSTTFTVVQPGNCGIPAPTLQWYRNVGAGDEMIVGATANTYTLANAQAADAGEYFCRLSNVAGGGSTVDSRRAVLTVTPDTAGPQIVQFIGVSGADNEWLVTFDEAVLPFGGGDDTFTYAITATDNPGVPFNVQTATIEAGNPAQVRLVTAESRVAGKSYRYTTGQDITDNCAGAVTGPGLTGIILQQVVIVAADDLFQQWSYDDTATDRGTTWKDVGYDDSSWKTGLGLFDGTAAGRTVVSGLNVGTQLQRRIVGTPYETVNVPTMYFRTHINLAAGSGGVTVRTVADDAYVLYVNGTEVSRLRVAAANDGFATYSAGGTVGAGNFEGPVTIPTALLNIPGDNVFAALLKQNDATSSDITWGLEVTALVAGITVTPVSIVQQPVAATVTSGHSLSLSVIAAGTQPDFQWFRDGTPIPGATSSTYSALATATANYYVVVTGPQNSVTSDTVTVTVRPVVTAYGATWKYSSDGAAADASLGGTPWFATAFDDSTWASGAGPFGIETTAGTIARLPAPIVTALPAPSATHLADYFRTTVTVPALTAGQVLVLTHLVDDGAVVYVDGVEAFRYNMPATTPVLSTTLAPAAAPGDGDANLVSIPVTLTPGTHLIAVEVHQNSATSSDAVFGAELRVISGTAPALTITHPTPGNVSVTWTANPLYSLFQATVVTGPFTAVGTNPQGVYNLAIPAADTERYFQLRFNGR